ncbi:MAG: hypothetical protein KatS3mg002_1040 [Candidatus Woesearchaeota archaeon]|nr:MAG: hypothetical protein KatS3mg002_1040 [Candidatus Woesearchaeota archaeon]
MGFYSRSFTYGGQPSELYGLEIASTNTGMISGNGSGNVSILESYIYRKPKPYFYGVTFDSKLSFDVSFFSKNEISAEDASGIQNWLFGSNVYRKLVITQGDMSSIYFNCIFTNPTILKAGNLLYGFSATAICDSQFAWTYPQTILYTFSGSYVDSTTDFYNDSHYQGYLYPQITINMNGVTNGLARIINVSDNNRIFQFTDLNPYENIIVDNELGIITSNSGFKRLKNFNKNFLRLIPMGNRLIFQGNIISISMSYQFARRLGG